MKSACCWRIGGLLLFHWLSMVGLPAQGTDLMEGLASSDPALRRKASRELSQRQPGEWLHTYLDRASKAPAEVRQRFLTALAKNWKLFPILVIEVSKGGPRRSFVRACLLASYRENRLPTPTDPTAVEVLPSTPLDLDGIRDLTDLWDRMLVAGDLGLPWLMDPRLDREGGAGRQVLGAMSGAHTLRELLPRIETVSWPGAATRGGLVTRILPEGIFVTSISGPNSAADFFLLCLEQYLGGDRSSGERAALCLAGMDLPGMGDLFLADLETPRRKRGLLGLVGEWHRGRGRMAADRLGPQLLDLYRKDPRWRYLVGSCLRDLLMVQGGLASWYGQPQDQWKEHPLDALLFAGLRLPVFGSWFEAELVRSLEGIERPDPIRTASLLDALSRLDGPLPVRLTELLSRRVQGVGSAIGTGMTEEVLAQSLKLLDRRAGEWLPIAPLRAAALGQSSQDGRLWSRKLGKMGERGWTIRILTLLTAKEAHPALLALASAPAPTGHGPSFATWSLMAQIHAGKLPTGMPEGMPARPGAAAGFLLDLGFHLLHADGGGGRARWQPVYASFDRLLLQAAERPIDTDPELARALGQSLGRHLLKLPRGPQQRRAGEWLGGWLVKPRTRSMGLAASILCLRHREHLLRDIEASMTSGLPPLEAVMLRRRLLLASRGRPAELGQAPVDTEDPLLRLSR